MTHMSINGQAAAFLPRPVIHPDVPAADRDLLAASLTPAQAARQLEHPPSRRSMISGHSSVLIWGAAAGMVFGAGQLARALIEQLRSQPPLQDLPSPAAMAHLMTALSIGVLVTGVIRYLTVGRNEAKAMRAVRLYRGCYLTAADLDEPAWHLLARAQYAVDTVTRSCVQRAGLVDQARNAVVLRNEEWEIAEALRAHTDLRTAQQNAAQTIRHRLAADVLTGQRHTLGLAVQAVTARVKALECYAEQVRIADAAYAELHTLRYLTAQEEQYHDLLAQTAADQLAAAQTQELSDQALQLATSLETDLMAEESGSCPYGRPPC